MTKRDRCECYTGENTELTKGLILSVASSPDSPRQQLVRTLAGAHVLRIIILLNLEWTYHLKAKTYADQVRNVLVKIRA